MRQVKDGFLLVRAGHRRVGLELSHVVEVTQLGSVHPVPSLEPCVRGVAAVHGKMVPVIHLGALLEGAACPASTTEVGVLVSIAGRRICLEVDDAELLVQDRGLPVREGTTLLWAVGVARYADGLVPLLDVQALSSRFMEAEPI
ncbi:MAG: chemotaxis protein CheW [Gemmatimonadales bacterium]